MQLMSDKEILMISGKAEDYDFTIKGLKFRHDDTIISVSDAASGILLEKFAIEDENDLVEIWWHLAENTFIKVSNLLKL